MMGLLRDMAEEDLDAVARIEAAVHAHPWTRGQFNDALRSGYVCRVAQEGDELTGYFVLMQGVEEAELLDISIAAAHQREGRGGALLQAALDASRSFSARRVLLEVRRSNAAAQALYRRAGFQEIAVRRGYYPAGESREDAIVMEKLL
ncbi:MAG: ribosomal protein S18-alanine N-acetyltransferase [Gallionellaceae bacterium]|jgi:ribosomal-protein-alanine N-acetyltransferase|nr:ribosomal protein S18-alanine N-acetyltransferase [Gallionellaceae bacterium]